MNEFIGLTRIVMSEEDKPTLILINVSNIGYIEPSADTDEETYISVNSDEEGIYVDEHINDVIKLIEEAG